MDALSAYHHDLWTAYANTALSHLYYKVMNGNGGQVIAEKYDKPVTPAPNPQPEESEDSEVVS